ncbi:hypothetical protein MTO96_009089 [Rhipicephalus appendiculatus]
MLAAIFPRGRGGGGFRVGKGAKERVVGCIVCLRVWALCPVSLSRVRCPSFYPRYCASTFALPRHTFALPVRGVPAQTSTLRRVTLAGRLAFAREHGFDDHGST